MKNPNSMINTTSTKQEKIVQDLNNNNVPVKKSANLRKNKNEMTVNTSNSTNNHANNNIHGNITMKEGLDAIAGLPNEKALLELMDKSGYQITQHNGQRKFGPPPNFGGT